jgi:molybdopterin adenylyltransferase
MSMPLRFGILTVSDRSARAERPDLSGPALVELITAQGWQVFRKAILPDDLSELRATLSAWADEGGLDVILTTGGTGFAPRDVTPEATRQVIEREAPGLAEAMRCESLKLNQHAMLGRGLAGIRGRVLIINLPGSPGAAVENLQVVIPVLPHAVELLNDQPDSERHHSTFTK